MEKYQPNSHRSRESQAEESKEKREIKKVVSGNVSTRENKGRKLTNLFISEDASNVKSYIILDVLVPAVKNAISAIVKDSVDMIFGTGGGGSGRKAASSRVSYRSYYDDKPSYRGRESDNYSGRFDFDDILFNTRGDAENVRRQMLDTIGRYGLVTVSDMYDMAGLVAPYTADRYGWTSLRTAEPMRVNGGYILRLPKASPID